MYLPKIPLYVPKMKRCLPQLPPYFFTPNIPQIYPKYTPKYHCIWTKIQLYLPPNTAVFALNTAVFSINTIVFAQTTTVFALNTSSCAPNNTVCSLNYTVFAPNTTVFAQNINVIDQNTSVFAQNSPEWSNTIQYGSKGSKIIQMVHIRQKNVQLWSTRVHNGQKCFCSFFTRSIIVINGP